HSVKELRSIGLQPDVVVGRSEARLEPSTREKIALFCDIPTRAVFSNPDVEDIYHVPLVIEDEGLDDYVLDHLGLQSAALPHERRDTTWRETVTRDVAGAVDIALVGKYGLEDAYMSIHEALKHAGFEHHLDVNVRWIASDEMTPEHEARLEAADGVVVPGGFGGRGTGGKIDAIEFARTEDVPFLGLCLGFQMAVVEYARNVLDLDGAHSTEVDPETPHPVIDLLPDQQDIDELGGTMRLGAHETQIEAGTLAHEVYGGTSCVERHRHRYEVNPDYIDDLIEAGLSFSGWCGPRMEILEVADHPFFLGTQFHPEFRSRPSRPSPPFVRFLEAANENRVRTAEEVQV
ncbi:MAG: CTP synthase, partial [Halobacteriota archaeon]